VLCTTHHTLVHEGGFAIRRHRDRHWYFVRPDGKVVETAFSSSAESVRQERAVYRLCSRARRDDRLDPLARV